MMYSKISKIRTDANQLAGEIVKFTAEMEQIRKQNDDREAALIRCGEKLMAFEEFFHASTLLIEKMRELDFIGSDDPEESPLLIRYQRATDAVILLCEVK